MKNLDLLTIERGKRLKKLRSSVLGMTAEEFSKLVGISRVTISYWENAINSGLTLRGAQIISDRLRNTEYAVEIDWLLYGDEKKLIDNKIIKNLGKSINLAGKEIEIFLDSDRNAEILKLKNDFIYPIFRNGDIVGGIWRPFKKIDIGKIINCIIKIENEKTLKALEFKDEKTYIILGSDKKTRKYKEIINNNFLIAPIIRYWGWDD